MKILAPLNQNGGCRRIPRRPLGIAKEVNKLSKRVLVVNDSFADRMMLRDLLISLGYSVVGEAKDGRESLEKYKELKPDLVIVDVAMRDMDGPSTVRELTLIDPDATILMCASHGQRALAMESLQAGAKDFIIKPINPRRFMKTLMDLLKERMAA